MLFATSVQSWTPSSAHSCHRVFGINSSPRNCATTDGSSAWIHPPYQQITSSAPCLTISKRELTLWRNIATVTVHTPRLVGKVMLASTSVGWRILVHVSIKRQQYCKSFSFKTLQAGKWFPRRWSKSIPRTKILICCSSGRMIES